MNAKKKLLITAGGTGGHLFPAQALATHIRALNPEIDILFAGGKLSQNPFFKSQEFAYQNIEVSTLSFRHPWRLINQSLKICNGLKKGLRIIEEFNPDLVVGFGSFYTFPILLAALIKKVPFFLHEQNSIPGKVNRFFSKRAKMTAITFPEAQAFIKGKTQSVLFPIRSSPLVTNENAYHYFRLDPQKKTVLIFGGSQGAQFINELMIKVSAFYESKNCVFQILHFTGSSSSRSQIENVYQKYAIPHCIKEFETRMDLAWKIAHFAITRAGAGSIAELIEYGVPALLIPFPYASDDHQAINALHFVNQVRGGYMMAEKDLTAMYLHQLLEKILAMPSEIDVLKLNIKNYKSQRSQTYFEHVVLDYLERPYEQQ